MTSWPARRTRLTAVLAGAAVAATMACVGGVSHTADAVPGGPTSVFDQSSVGWLSYRDQSSSKFAKTFKDKKADYIPVDLEIDTPGSQYKVGSVWQSNTDGRAWREKRNLSSNAYKNYWNNARDDGFRLVEHETYVVGGKRLFAGIWIKNVEGYAWASHRGQTNSEFKDTYADHRADGLQMIDYDQYSTSNGMRYSTVWVQQQNRDWKFYRNKTGSQWHDIFEDNAGYRVLTFESLKTGNGQRYAGVFVSNDTGRGAYFRRDMNAKGYNNWWYRYRDLGYRLVGLDRYETANGTRYAGMWRQNNDRPNWSLRSDVDERIQSELDRTGVPGISVAVYQNGVASYLRGFGNADIDDHIWMDSTHVGSIASVSKAVAGVLTMRMVEQDLLDLDDPTRDWVPSMPNHHTHTVGDLVANRGCVRHYGEGPSSGFADKSYSTALKAAKKFWDDPLVCTVGAYHYSTHGYTLLGAALEAAGGDDVKDLVRKKLTNPFKLGTLGPQKSGGHRMALYVAGDDEIDVPVNDWKVLGGGLDSSVADLARFGAKLIDEDILSEDSLDTMWTPPDGGSSYAYGWSTGTESGWRVVAKNGSWDGNLAYLRMFPDAGISVAVMMNDRSGNQDSDQLGRDIATMVLGTVVTR